MNNAPESAPRPAKRQRASRKGQPRRFLCEHEGCDKKYTRAEHLARHQLNHTPKQVFHCDVEGCSHWFVRLDLFVRHKKKHDEGSSPLLESRTSPSALKDLVSPRRTSSNVQIDPLQTPSTPTQSLEATTHVPFPTAAWRAPLQHLPLPAAMPSIDTSFNSPQLAFPSSSQQPSPAKQHLVPMPNNDWLASRTNLSQPTGEPQDQINENFAAWLFESPGSQEYEFGLSSLPSLNYGLDLAQSDPWDFRRPPASVASHDGSQVIGVYTAGRTPDARYVVEQHDAHIHISDARREQIVRMCSAFWRKKPPPNAVTYMVEHSLFFGAESQTWPNLTTSVLRDCMIAFWRDVRMPIVHQATFSCSNCNILLLLSMITLGAAQLVRLSRPDSLRDYREFADLIALNLRWEIFTDDDSHPPIQLCLAQALVLLELYEKMYTSRKLHERAHIHHASTLTLLRRGTPLVGHTTTDGDSPRSGFASRGGTPTPAGDDDNAHIPSAVRWWRRWARNESMHRVVFAAFQMDTLHAVLFGHESILLPYEIRLVLPCDDALWSATSPEEHNRIDASLSLRGNKSMNFLDGLKRCLHGHDVQSHHNARLILMTGLMSVGWHMNRRDTNLQFLETLPAPSEHSRWPALLAKAFGHWRRNFDDALGGNQQRGISALTPSDNTTADPVVLSHIAYITSQSDIIDMQILAGSKRLLGRRITGKDYEGVEKRMMTWVISAGARIAVHHSFQLLHETLVVPVGNHGPRYRCRADPSIYRPWGLYLSALTIWAWQYATVLATSGSFRPPLRFAGSRHPNLAYQYITDCANSTSPDHFIMSASLEGCMAILELLSEDFAEAEWDILREVSRRLRNCRNLLSGSRG